MCSILRFITLAASVFLCAAPGQAQEAIPLSITQVSPQGEVENLTQITVRFSENMRPLGVMEQDAATSPLRLTVAGGDLPPGNFRWLDPATLSYLFDGQVVVPLEITASVPAGTAALNGNKLVAKKTWNLSTPRLVIQKMYEYPLPPQNATFEIQANYALNLDDLRKYASLSMDGKVLPIEIKLREFSSASVGKQTNWVYQISVLTDLPPDKQLVFHLASGIMPENGGSPAEATTFKLESYGSLRLERWQMGYRSEDDKGPVAPENTLDLSFNNPVQRQDVLAHLKIEPNVTLVAEEDRDPKDLNAFWSFAFEWKAQTTYKVTIQPGLSDGFGTKLAKAAKFSFTTSNFSPIMHMQQGFFTLESGLGARLPLTIRNVSPISLHLRYLPWNAQTFAAYPWQQELDNAEYKAQAGAWKTLTLDFPGRTNANIRHDLDLPAVLGVAGPAMQGLVDVRARFSVQSPRNNEPYEDQRDALVQVTNIGLGLKAGAEKSLAWVTSLDSGQPLEGAALSLVDFNGNTMWQGQSGPFGLAELPGTEALPAGIGFLTARLGDDTSVLPLDNTRLSQDFQNWIIYPEYNANWRVHTVTQLPLYQPGQEVNFTLYARYLTAKDGQNRLRVPEWRPVADEELTLTVTDNRGEVVHSQSTRSNPYGSVTGSFSLAEEANLGTYYVEVSSDRFESTTHSTGFEVASFRPPDFKVDVTAPDSQPQLLPTDAPLTVGLKAVYFTGAALPDAQTRLALSRARSYFAPSLLSGYTTGYDTSPFPWRVHGKIYYSPHERNAPFATLNAQLDSEGKATFVLPDVPIEPGRPEIIKLEATVTDSSGLTTQGSADFTLHPSTAYVGIRGPRFVPSGTNAIMELKAATWDDKPIATGTIHLRAERLVNDHEYEFIWEKDIAISGPNGQELPIAFEKSGIYYLSASITDAEGRKNVSRTVLMVPGAHLEWQQQPDGNELELIPNASQYQPGDTAQIVIINPFETALALITTERDSVITYRVQEISGSAPSIEIPLSDLDAPYVFASVTLLKGRTAPPPDGQKLDGQADKGAPRVAFGVVCLQVKDSDPGLMAEVKTDKASYRPGGEVTATVRVTDLNGKPLQTQVTLLAVDERILRAAGENTAGYEPDVTFARVLSYGIDNADTRTRMLNLNVPLLRDRKADSAGRAMEAPMAAMASPAPAQGGSAETTLRQNFSPMALWLAEGQTDANGTLSTSFTLPDTLTSYRIVAVAADQAHRFATAQNSFQASKPLQLLSSMPRFATEGDKLEARVLVQNMGTVDGVITVKAEAEGMALLQATRTINLPAGQSGMVAFPLAVAEPGLAVLRVTGSMGQETDRAQFTLPILPAAPLTTVAAAGLLKEGETHTVPVLTPVPLDQRSKMAVIFAASPAAGMPLSAESVLSYPWDCLEQRLSRAWVRALRLQYGDMLGLPADPHDKTAIQDILRSVAQFQDYDGGMRLWPGPRETDFYLTAYAMLVNSETKKLNLSVSERVEQRAYDYLSAKLREYSNLGASKRSGSIVAEALSLLVLVEADPESVHAFFPGVLDAAEQSAGSSPMAWGCLLLTTHAVPVLADREDAVRRITLALEKTAAITPTQMHFPTNQHDQHWMSMGSTLRDNGMLLAALTTALPEYPRLEALAAWLSQGVGERKYLSTQEGVYGVWGLATYLQSLGGDRPISLEAVWNDNNRMTKSFTRLVDPPVTWTLPASKLAPGQNSNLVLTAKQGNPYWTVRLTYASPSLPIQPENAGLTITRQWLTPGPWTMGDIVDVSVTLIVPATRRHVLLFDPFPAGLEPVHATRVDLANAANRYQYPWAWEDTRTDGMLLYATRVDPGVYTYTYQLRAAAPGSFVQRPSYAEEMYTPEVFGRTADDLVHVKP